jgi:hypothetical protein
MTINGTGVGIFNFNWYYLSSPPRILRCSGSVLNEGDWHYIAFNGHSCGCATAVAVGQRQRLYSDVRMLTWIYLSSIQCGKYRRMFVGKGPTCILIPGHWYLILY